MSPHKSHPDYSDGYFDALDGADMAKDTEPYKAGWKAANDARRMLLESGFEEQPGGRFTKTMVVR